MQHFPSHLHLAENTFQSTIGDSRRIQNIYLIQKTFRVLKLGVVVSSEHKRHAGMVRERGEGMNGGNEIGRSCGGAGAYDRDRQWISGQRKKMRPRHYVQEINGGQMTESF